MRILILGGTVFVGRHIAQAALERGHDVTLFNRGTRPDLPGTEALRGDRDGGLDALAGRSWDAVLDTSGYLPRLVGDAARMLRDAAPRYAFVSTISVYEQPLPPHADEDAPLATLDDPELEEVRGDTYGGLKVRCEGEVRAAYPDAHLILRPGIVVGPHDPTDRFTYWVRRMAGDGEVAAPDAKGAPVQWIDARDLAGWAIDALERETSGTFNVVAPPDTYDLAGLLRSCREVAGSAAEVVWVDPAFLDGQGIRPFADLPLWLPGDAAHLFRVDAGRARREGLDPRPLAATVADTLAWDRERGTPDLRAGLTPERERELLEAWRTRG